MTSFSGKYYFLLIEGVLDLYPFEVGPVWKLILTFDARVHHLGPNAIVPPPMVLTTIFYMEDNKHHLHSGKHMNKSLGYSFLSIRKHDTIADYE